MEAIIKTLLNSVESSDMTAELFSDDNQIGTSIEYSLPSDMKLLNLKPDMPPYVWFKNGKILYSKDNVNWGEVPSYEGFEMFKLFDPRIVLRHLSVKKEDKNSFSGVANISAILGSEYLEKTPFHKNSDQYSFKHNNGKLLEMSRNDFIPSNEIIRFVFSYKSKN